MWVTVGWGRAKLHATDPASTAWSWGRTEVWVTVGWGMSKTQATAPAFTAWSVGTGVAGVWVTVGSGRSNTQATLPALTAWSVGRGGAFARQSYRPGLVGKALDVQDKGDYFGGVSRRPLIYLRHVRIGEHHRYRLAVASGEGEAPGGFKFGGESIVGAGD